MIDISARDYLDKINRQLPAASIETLIYVQNLLEDIKPLMVHKWEEEIIQSVISMAALHEMEKAENMFQQEENKRWNSTILDDGEVPIPLPGGLYSSPF